MNINLTSERTRGVRRQRLMTVVAAVVAALAVWIVARAAGVHVQSPAFGSQEPQDINAGFAVFVSGVASLLGWASLALLERLTNQARKIWPALAVVILILSLGLPLSGSGVTGGDRLSLLLMHVAVGAVLIPGLARTARRASKTGDALDIGASPAAHAPHPTT